MKPLRRTRLAAQVTEPASPVPVPTGPGGLLEAYGARLAPDFAGTWVYAFADRGSDGAVGAVWYAGQSEHLWSRWRDHYYHWKDRFTSSAKYAIPVRDKAQANIVELALIDFYQPECNTQGRAEQLRAEISSMVRANRGNFPRLDQSQETY